MNHPCIKSRLTFQLTFLSILLFAGNIGAMAQMVITARTPQVNANNVSLNSNISVTFDQTINGTTLTSSNVVVRGSQTGVITGVLSGGGSNTIIFDPTKNFRLGEVITVTINTSLKSASNASLVRGNSYSFTAISGPAPSTPPTFAPRHTAFNIFTAEEDIAAMDFDGDGDLDQIVSGFLGLGTGYTYLWENNGNQDFCSKMVGHNRNVEMYDMDGDGDLDNVAPGGNDVNLYWHRNDGGGVFTAILLSTSNIVWNVTAGDLDSDGDLDIVASMANGNGTNSIKWMINNGSGTFSSLTAIASFTGGSYSRFRVIDMNKDGAMDILGYDQNGLKLVWYQNNGSQVFTERPIGTFSSSLDYQRFSWGDLDNDGDIDVFSAGLNSTPTLYWYENDGSQNFTLHSLPLITPGNRLNFVRMLDIDGDLDMDLLAGGHWFENNGAQTFTQMPVMGMEAGVTYYAVTGNFADMEGDGDMDLLMIGQDKFSWHENGRFMNITSTSPVNGKFDVAANSNISITFSQPVKASSVNSNSIRIVSKVHGPVSGVFSGGGTNTIVFDPTTDFVPGDRIEVSINSKITGSSNEILSTNYGFDFRVKVSVATASPTFTYSSIKIHSTTIYSMDIADMDSDGDMDIVSCSSSELFWHRNNGSGSFTTIPITTSISPRDIVATDYNNDGHMDILVRGTAGYFYTNDGSQNFTESTIMANAGGANPQMIDVDRDGDTDIVMAGTRWGDRYCNVFGSGVIPSVSGNRAIRAADMDNDGDMDFMGAGSGGSVIYSNKFLQFTNTAIEGANAYNLDLADLDGDGDIDPVYVLTSSSIAWYPNNLTTASANFGARKTIGSLTADPRSVFTTDLDGDGDADVAAVARTSDNIVWYRNRLNEGTADFAPALTLPLNSDGPILVKSGDMNGDGRMDLVVISDIDNELAWYANSSSPLPTITSFNPTSGPVGTTVTITGTNFSTTPGNNVVKFNGTTATVTSSTSTSITTTVPTGATTGTISVTVAGNTATSATNFTVTAAVVPTITSFTPSSGLIGTTVTITGTNFSTTPGNNTVKFNGTTASVTASSATSITTSVPAGATTGKITVTVGGNTATSASNFVVLPAITGFTPASGPTGTIVTITGTNFDPVESNNIVRFNGEEGIVYSATTTTLEVEVPPAATTGSITVTVGANTATSATPFTVLRCTAPRTNGELDVSYDPLVQDPVPFTSIELQSTGKSIVATQATTINGVSVQGLIRFNTDGSLDASFTSASIDPYNKQMLIQPDDKIIAINNSGTDTFLDRYNADGTKDASFTQTTFSTSVTYPYYFGTIGLQADGKILYVLYSSFDGQDEIFRLNADGTPDAAFAGPKGLGVNVIKPLANGKILIGTSYAPSVYLLDNTGAIDPSFDPGSGADDSVLDIAVQSDGKIIIAGNFTSFNGANTKQIARINSNGTLDTTLNSGLGADSGIESIKLLSNNQIVIAGYFSRYDIGQRTYLAKINSDGSLDCSFDPGTSSDGPIYDLAIQADGKILIAGEFTSYDGGARIALARVNNLVGAPVITINLQPSDVSTCAGSTAIFTTSANGTTGITYQWQFSTNISPFVFNDITNNANFSGVTTPTLNVNTSGSFGAGRYRCKINGDLAATVFTADKGLLINTSSTAPTTSGASGCGPISLTLTASGGTNGQYRWYSVPSGGVAISGQVNNSFTTPVLSATTTYYVSINNGSCESPRTSVIATILSTGCNNMPPVISSASATTVIGGTATIGLVTLLSDPDNNLDLSTLKIAVQPASGAPASIDANRNLKIDYSGNTFAGTDALTIEVCDMASVCTQKILTIEVSGDIIVYNALSPGGANPMFYIQNIDALPETKTNTVTIFDRWENEVWKGNNYDNVNVVFKGVSSAGNDLPSGVYFYKLDFVGKKSRTGFISLRR